MDIKQITSIKWLTIKLHQKLIDLIITCVFYCEPATTNRSNLTQYCQSNAQ